MKSTKKALFTSALSLLLCVSMLIGTTFAWFTDSVTSGVNQIVAGNLDIDVQYTRDNGTTWASLQDAKTLFGTDLWEPGHTEYVTLKIENKGTLALNYKVLVSPVTEKGGVNKNGESFKLSDYLMFGTTAASEELTTYTRTTARDAVTATAMGMDVSAYTQEGQILGTVTTPAPKAQYVTLVVYMPETVGNEANYKTGTAAPEINLGITVLATQMTSEKDSFSNSYDAGAVESNYNGVGPVYDYYPQVSASTPVPTESFANVTVSASGKLNKGDADPTKLAEVIVPAAAIAAGAKEVTVSVKPVEATNLAAQTLVTSVSNDPNKEAVNFDIKVEGIEPNTADIKVSVFVGKGLSNAKVYHNGTLIENATYNATTGYVSFETQSFSDYTMVYDAAVAAIGTQTYGSLKLANDAAQPGETISLLKNVTLNEALVVNKNLTINLNGKTITGNGARALHVAGGNVEITGSGLITVTEGISESSSAIRVGDNNGDQRTVALTIGSGVTVKSDYSYGVTVFGSKTTETVTINGTVKTAGVPAISGNGSAGYGDTNITVNGTVETTSENAIYHPQSGTLTVNGTVKGQGGIEAKAGTITLGENAVVTATGSANKPGVNNNGCSTSGYAIAAVENSNYAAGVQVTVTQGTVNGKVAVENDTDVAAAKKAVISISGGTFSNDPSDYVVDGKLAAKNSSGMFVIEDAPTEQNGEYSIANAAQLMWFARQVNKKGNTFSGKTVNLTADIDMKGTTWVPIGGVNSYPSVTFSGTFDGQNHTVSNLTGFDMSQNYASAGFFGSICGTVKNLTLKNVDFTSTHYVGGIVGYSSANTATLVKNCHVIDGKITSVVEQLSDGTYDNGDKVGGIIGYCVGGDMIEDCSVTNVTIQGYRDIGGICGYANNGNSDKITNCSISGVKIIVDNSHNYKNYTSNTQYDANSIIGECTNATDPSCSGVAEIVYPNN